MKGIPPRSLSVTLASEVMGCDGAAISTSSSAQTGSTRQPPVLDGAADQRHVEDVLRGSLQ